MFSGIAAKEAGNAFAIYSFRFCAARGEYFDRDLSARQGLRLLAAARAFNIYSRFIRARARKRRKRSLVARRRENQDLDCITVLGVSWITAFIHL